MFRHFKAPTVLDTTTALPNNYVNNIKYYTTTSVTPTVPKQEKASTIIMHFDIDYVREKIKKMSESDLITFSKHLNELLVEIQSNIVEKI